MEAQLKSYFSLQLGPLLAGESVDLDTASNLAGGVTRVDVSPSGAVWRVFRVGSFVDPVAPAHPREWPKKR